MSYNSRGNKTRRRKTALSNLQSAMNTVSATETTRKAKVNRKEYIAAQIEVLKGRVS